MSEDRKLALADEPKEQWSIKTVDDRKFAFRVLAKAEEKRAWLKSERDRFEAWYAEEEAAITTGTAFMRAEVERYATVNRDLLVRIGTKTAKLPEGEISWRKSGGRLLVTDKEALAQWCVEEGPEKALYRVKTEPEMVKVQSLFKATGVIPPGCDVEPEVESITIKPSMPLLPKENP